MPDYDYSVKKEIYLKQQSNASSISKIEMRLNETSISEKLAERLSRQLKLLAQKQQSLNDILNEIDILKKSSQLYDISISTLYGDDYGTIKWNNDLKRVDITIPDKFNYNLLAHELQHAYQFEVGEYALAIQKDPKILDFISDIYDEVSAYIRGGLFGGTVYSASELVKMKEYKDHLKYKSSISSRYPNYINDPVSLWKLAKGKQSAFRINGITYYSE